MPLLIAAFSVQRTDRLALAAPTTPATQFDGSSALALAQELSRLYPDRAPGSSGSLGASRWLIDRMRLYSYVPQVDAFEETIPGRGRTLLRNVSFATGPADADAIVVMAHRDDSGLGAGANDNASGTAALIELARAYGRPAGAPAQASGPNHQLIFLSTDGGVFGGLGARRFVERYPDPSRIVAVVNLDSIAGRGPPRVEIAGDEPRSPAASLVATAAARIAEQTGSGPGRTSALGQLTDLGFPFSFYEQAPLVGRGVPAITLTTAGNRPPASFGDTPGRLDANRKQLTDIGSAAQDLIGSIDEFGLVDGGRSYVYLGQRLVHGWAIELALVAMLVPFAVAAVDLFARCRRRRIPVLPALRACRSRLGVWLWTGLMFLFLGALGVLAGRCRRSAEPGDAGGDSLAGARNRPPRRAGATGLARVTRAARAAATGNRRGGARGPHGGHARARRRRAARGRDQPLRPPLPAPLSAHLALAPPHAEPRRPARGSGCCSRDSSGPSSCSGR